jgi:hypothetical protein
MISKIKHYDQKIAYFKLKNFKISNLNEEKMTFFDIKLILKIFIQFYNDFE